MPQIAALKTIAIGDFKVTFLPDGGGVVNPTALYPASTEEGWQKHGDLLDEDGKFITTIGVYMVEIGERRIAVDLGIGPATIDFPGFGPFSGGKYLESVAKLGVSRFDVTDLIFTHLHLDHVGWTTFDMAGERVLTYPNARVMCTAVEWEYWHGGDNPAGPHPETVQKPLEDRIEYISGGDEIAPGLTVISTPGHTPGHISLLIDDGEQRLFLLGDVFHGAMQMQEMDWSVAFDVDQAQARQTREQLYAEITRPNTLIAANHFSNEVFGRVQPDGDVYAWQPL